MRACVCLVVQRRKAGSEERPLVADQTAGSVWCGADRESTVVHVLLGRVKFRNIRCSLLLWRPEGCVCVCMCAHPSRPVAVGPAAV